ncbi:hypothetical protein [Paraliobacillus sp. X-1268]|uniref:hypothetical protein n=1 Tax=Paraliobacillus sp. X-1268 TaxID=2213193 RepID=UPI0013004003|nr:hypothetical protein [Paraliobacillus sp. X-1268]
MIISTVERKQTARDLGVRSQIHMDQFCFLIKSEEELQEFKDWYCTESIIESILMYKSFKRYVNKISRDSFIELAKDNKKLALEKHFQEPVSDSHMDLIEKLGLSCVEIYDKKNLQGSRTLRYILTNWDLEMDNDDSCLFVI